jgi:predicted membrane protein
LLTLVILALQTKAYCNIFFVKTNRIIWIAILAVLATITYYSLTGKQSLEKYTQELLQERKEKDLFMQSNSGSPFVVASVPP